eukprot:364663-Chlamydomonas_euryale.AAC.2
MPVRCTAAVHRSGVRMRPSAQQCLELLIVNLRLAAADDLCDIDPQIKILRAYHVAGGRGGERGRVERSEVVAHSDVVGGC